KIHVSQLNQTSKYELTGFYEPSKENTEKVSGEFGYHSFDSIEELFQSVDVVEIVTPTLSHYDWAVRAIKAGKHIFLEKLISNTTEKAEHIIRLTTEYNVKRQVGHVYRLNRDFNAVQDKI